MLGDGIRPLVSVVKALELAAPGSEIFPGQVVEVSDPCRVGLAKTLGIILGMQFCGEVIADVRKSGTEEVQEEEPCCAQVNGKEVSRELWEL